MPKPRSEPFVRVRLISISTEGAVVLECVLLQGAQSAMRHVRLQLGQGINFLFDAEEPVVEVTEETKDLLKSISKTPPAPDIKL
jgi:hypothetical protein